MESFIVIDGASSVLLLARYFFARTEAWKAMWEARLAEATREYWPEAMTGTEVVVELEGRAVILTGRAGLVLIVTATETYDAMGASEDLAFLVQVLDGVCDERLSPGQLSEFHGKACVAVDEAVHQGHILHKNVENVLRLAKLKHSTSA